MKEPGGALRSTWPDARSFPVEHCFSSMIYLKSRGAKSFKSLRHVSHSCAVPGDEKNTYLISAFSYIVRNDPIAPRSPIRFLVRSDDFERCCGSLKSSSCYSLRSG